MSSLRINFIHSSDAESKACCHVPPAFSSSDLPIAGITSKHLLQAFIHDLADQTYRNPMLDIIIQLYSEGVSRSALIKPDP